MLSSKFAKSTSRKALAFILAISAFFGESLATLTASAATAYYYMGDYDGNGEVNVTDARAVLRVAIKLETVKSEEAREVADMDGNSEINVSDARAILRAAIKLDELRVCKEGEEEKEFSSLTDPIFFSWKAEEPDLRYAGQYYVNGEHTTREKALASEDYAYFDEAGYYHYVVVKPIYIPETEKSYKYCPDCGKYIYNPYTGTLSTEHVCYEADWPVDPVYGSGPMMDTYCKQCGMNKFVGKVTCHQFICDCNCTYCGKPVKAFTCHHCHGYEYGQF